MSNRVTKLSVKNVRKVHGSVVALDDACLDLHEGEFLTLLGPSGSGKTTLLMIVAGLTEPTQGEVWIDGVHATYAPPHKRDIGVVFQNYALFPHLSVSENVAFPLRMRGISNDEIDHRVREALDTVHLEHTSDRLPRNLSGGQQQRIALARCIVYKPSIILMDEPLGALDRKLRDQMQLEIKRLHQKLGITVLYVTHDQDEAMTMSDRICLMNDGRIEQIGRPEELYFQPDSMFVADFIGDSNFLEVMVLSQLPSGQYLLEGPDGIQLTAKSRYALPDRAKAKLVVRPESVRLVEDGASAQNEFVGILRESVFVGSVYRFSLEATSGVQVWGKQFSHTAGKPLSVGSTARVGWNSAESVLLPNAS